MIQYVIENLWLLWLIVSIVCLTLELTSGDLYMICIAMGALIGMACGIADMPFWVQVLVTAVASVACIVFVRPSMVRHLHNKEERNSNADALVGQQGVVTDTIPSNGYGYVKIAGDQWRSVSHDKTPIETGCKVTVVSRESTILTVSR